MVCNIGTQHEILHLHSQLTKLTPPTQTTGEVLITSRDLRAAIHVMYKHYASINARKVIS